MKPFLTAEWRNLILLTYSVDPSLLDEYLPESLELDLYKHKAFVSFVAFDFMNTRLKGIPIPFHINFPEINLRFYVRHTDSEGLSRRGVVFIKELVPKYFIAKIARKFYNEPYELAETMRSEFAIEEGLRRIEHRLEYRNQNHYLQFKVEDRPYFPEENSSENFFKEHEWGFGRNRQGQLTEYRVEHPVWRLYPIKTRFQLRFDFGSLYGEQWSFMNNQIPYNIQVAEGSGVKIFQGRRVK